MHLALDGHRPATTALAAALLTIGLLASPGSVAATGTVTVDLGRAAPFAVLAGSGVVATGLPHVRGEVGAYPAPAVSDVLDAASAGAVHRGGAVAQLAQADLAAAYAAATDATPTAAVHRGAVDGATLEAGVYSLAGDPIGLGGHLVLDGGGDSNATWIFHVPSGLVTAPGSMIDLVGGAQACNVFWQVAGAATLGAGSTFAGTILAASDVTVEGGVTLDGRLLTTAGRVLLGDDTVVLPECSGAPPGIDTAVQAAAVVGATTDRAPPGSAASGEVPARSHPPSALPLLAIALLILAALLGEPWRRRRPAAVGPW